jgi:hypothetical protein
MKIELTETEIFHIMDALDARIEDLADTLTFGDDPIIQDQIGEMRDLATDLFEAISRKDDGWDDPEDPDLFMDPVDFQTKHDHDPSDLVICDAESRRFNADIKPREKWKTIDRKMFDSETRIFSASLVMEQLASAPVSMADQRRQDRFGELEIQGTASMAVHRKHKRKPKRLRGQNTDQELSETQRFDLWDDRDPRNW